MFHSKIPDYYREVFIELTSVEGFDNVDLVKFAEWVRLRNILAHEYLDIKWNRIEKFILEGKPQFKLLLEAVKNILK